MQRPSRQPWLGLGLLLAALLGLASCSPAPPLLDQVRQRGELRVVTLNSPTSYYLGAHGPEGLEFELSRAFAERLGVAVLIYPVRDVEAMRDELASGRADIAAAQITADSKWSRAGLPARVYDHVPQIVVHRRDKPAPRSIAALKAGRIAVRAGSPQEQLLRDLKLSESDGLRWLATAPDTADPLDDVRSGGARYAVVDSREFSFARHLYPELAVAFELPNPRPVQWVLRKGARDMLTAVDRYFADLEKNGELKKWIARSTGAAKRFEYQESVEFQAQIAARLPQVRSWFEEAAEQTGLDWRLIAAIGYQESKWDPRAESPDGAIGVMMLTGSTAESLGVKDRTDPRASIFAGAKYFVDVRSKIPSRIPEPDRTWFAVAAYNVGYGHLEDARVLAQERGKSPDSWKDVAEALPLLAQEEYYLRAKRGYARGWEPVRFVQQVQEILKLLEWHDTQQTFAEEAVWIRPRSGA